MVDSRKRSLLIAKQHRMCPPRDVWSNPMHEKKVRLHLSVCPYCSPPEPEDVSIWDDLAQGLRSAAAEAGAAGPESVPEKGSICLIKSERGGWAEGNFYNPPAVLIIEKAGVVSDDVLVAQTYHDTVLAGPGDLILEGDRSPVGEIFIEPWNTYTLRLRDLDRPLCRIEESIVEAVMVLDGDPAAYPEWALHPRPMAPDDPRIYFREMEVEVGFFFSSAAVSGLLDDLPLRPLHLIYGSTGEAVAEIKTRVPGVGWPQEPQSIEQALATAQFPPEHYAMAAASADRELFPANLVTVRSGRVERIAPLEGEIRHRSEGPEGLVVGGRIFIPGGTEILEVLCFLETGDGDFISSEPPDWDRKGHFRARFPVSSLQNMDLFIAVLHEAADERTEPH